MAPDRGLHDIEEKSVAEFRRFWIAAAHSMRAMQKGQFRFFQIKILAIQEGEVNRTPELHKRQFEDNETAGKP